MHSDQSAPLLSEPKDQGSRGKAGIFSLLTNPERHSLVRNLIGILPQRGCLQCCAGCHAAAIGRLAPAEWSTIAAVLQELGKELRTWAHSNDIGERPRLIEIFRDSDPAQYHFPAQGGSKGVGDFAELIYRTTGLRAKIMTAGPVPAELKASSAAPPPSPEDFLQLQQAARYAGRISISLSIQTLHYRRFGLSANARLLAATTAAAAAGAAPDTEVFLDLMRYSENGSDCESQATLELLREVLGALPTALLSIEDKQLLLEATQSAPGARNFAYLLPDRRFGVRISPYLRIGRAAARHSGGRFLHEVSVSDRLAVLPGRPQDRIGLRRGSFTFEVTRRDLQQPGTVSRLLALLQGLEVSAFLAEEVDLWGDWLGMFRSEIDLSPPLAGVGRTNLQRSPGLNLEPGINLLLSDQTGGELQRVIPFKRLLF